VLDDGTGVAGQGTSDGGGPGSGSTGPGLPGSGQGLAGMAERARIYSGTVEAGPGDRGWRVRAVLNCPDLGPAEPPTRPHELQGKK